MARIPTVISRAEITPRAPAVRRPVAAARRVGEEIVAAGKTLENIGAMYERARDLNQYTKAGTEIDKRLLEIKGKAANTPINSTEDFDNIVKTSKEGFQKIRDEVLTKISNPETRLKMGGAFDISELKTLNSIKGEGRRRWEDMMKADAMGRFEALKEIYTEENRPEFKEIAKNEIKELMNNHIELGVFKKAPGLKLLRDTLDSLPILDAENMIEKDPVEARRMLIKNEFGDVGKEKERLLKLADTTIKRNKQAAKNIFNFEKDAEEQAASNAIKDNNITTISQIDKLPRASESFKEAAKRLVLSKKKLTPVELSFEYTKLLRQRKALNIDKDGNIEKGLEEIARFRVNLINAWDKGVITESSYKNQLALVDDAYNEDTREIFKTKIRQSREITGFWESLFTVFTTFTPILKAKGKGVIEIIEKEVGLPEQQQDDAMTFMDKELTNRLLEGEIPEGKVNEVATEIFKKYLRTIYPEMTGLPDIPNSIYDAERGFNNVNNSSFKGEAEWEYRDGKLIRIKKKEK